MSTKRSKSIPRIVSPGEWQAPKLETPEPNLVAGMAWLQSTYTLGLNDRHRLFGHVFSGRYRSQLVEGSGNGYLKTACDYVHLNPVRAGLLKAEERLPGLSLEQFGRVYRRAGASAVLDSCGPAAGGARNPGRFRVRAAAIRAAIGDSTL